MKIIYLFLFILCLTSCKNDQLEEAIKGTYYNNNYKLEIKIGFGAFMSPFGINENVPYNQAILYKWEEEHERFDLIGSEIEGPGYYEIDQGQWKIDDGNLILTFYNEEEGNKDWEYKIIPINFNPSASKDWHNMNASFILRGSEQNFFPALVSQGYHSK
jgi:hypothetical protein